MRPGPVVLSCRFKLVLRMRRWFDIPVGKNFLGLFGIGANLAMGGISVATDL